MAAGSKCGGCDNQVTENENAVACDRCREWYHKDCAGIDAGEFNILKWKKMQSYVVMLRMQTQTATNGRHGSTETEYGGARNGR
jgi:hypothetical protein